MKIPEIVTGDDLAVPITLKKDNETFNIPVTADVKVALLSSSRLNVLVSPVTVLSTTPGSDWANSLIVVVVASSTTIDIENRGRAFFEIQVDDNGKTTWFVEVTLVGGNIP